MLSDSSTTTSILFCSIADETRTNEYLPNTLHHVVTKQMFLVTTMLMLWVGLACSAQIVLHKESRNEIKERCMELSQKTPLRFYPL